MILTFCYCISTICTRNGKIFLQIFSSEIQMKGPSFFQDVIINIALPAFGSYIITLAIGSKANGFLLAMRCKFFLYYRLPLQAYTNRLVAFAWPVKNFF